MSLTCTFFFLWTSWSNGIEWCVCVWTMRSIDSLSLVHTFICIYFMTSHMLVPTTTITIIVRAKKKYSSRSFNLFNQWLSLLFFLNIYFICIYDNDDDDGDGRRIFHYCIQCQMDKRFHFSIYFSGYIYILEVNVPLLEHGPGCFYVFFSECYERFPY